MRRINCVSIVFASPSRLSLLEAHLDSRHNTLLYCFNAVNVVAAIHKLNPEFKTRFPSDRVQRICGTLDTNCYDLSWDRVKARAIYQVRKSRILNDRVRYPDLVQIPTTTQPRITFASYDYLETHLTMDK